LNVERAAECAGQNEAPLRVDRNGIYSEAGAGDAPVEAESAEIRVELARHCKRRTVAEEQAESVESGNEYRRAAS
jgi:hypothetical protein